MPRVPRGPVSGFTCRDRVRDVGNEKSEKFIFSKISGVIGQTRGRAKIWIKTRAQTHRTLDSGMPDDLSQKFSFTVNLDILPPISVTLKMSIKTSITTFLTQSKVNLGKQLQ